jgi:hypothetical protein
MPIAIPAPPTLGAQLIPDRPQARVLTAEERAYVDQPQLTAAQQAAYDATLRGMTEEQLNAERSRVQEHWHLFQYVPATRPNQSALDRRPNHPDVWRSARVNEEAQRRHERSNEFKDSVAGGIIGTALGAGVGALAGNSKKGAVIGGVAGAIAPHISEAAEGLTRGARFVLALALGRGPGRY